jgi:hypothetical protein
MVALLNDYRRRSVCLYKFCQEFIKKTNHLIAFPHSPISLSILLGPETEEGLNPIHERRGSLILLARPE